MKQLFNTLQAIMWRSASGLPLCAYLQNVGIGTNGPAPKLDVAGNVKILQGRIDLRIAEAPPS